MTDLPDPPHERPELCEAVSVAPTRNACPCTERTLALDDAIQCSNDASGKVRISPDYGEDITIWLCEDCQYAYDEYIIETVTVT